MRNEQELVIEAGRAEKHYWADLWRYRELLYILSWRDITVRYKQTAVGLLWAFLRPILTMLVFTLIFSKLAKLPADGHVPYPIMVFAGMLPWQFFASALVGAGESLVGNTQLITKVYFPRIIIPVSSVVTSFVDFMISFGLLLVLCALFRFVPSWHIVFLPFFLLLAFLTAAGIGLYITAFNVKYRDFRQIVPFIVQFGLYISPVGFSSSIVPEKYRILYSLNPMVGIIDGFRWCILGGQSSIYWPSLLTSMAVTLFFLAIGIRKFRRMERGFADII